MLRLNRCLFTTVVRCQHGINTPSGSTGIEHSNQLSKVGKQFQQKPADYKCSEYLNFHKYSYYNVENQMNSYRVKQPTPKEHDKEPSVKTQ